MKAILSIAAVFAALALCAPAGARPLYDPPLHPLKTQPAAPPPAPAAHPSDDTVEVAVIVGAIAFLFGAGAAQLVRAPRRRTA